MIIRKLVKDESGMTMGLVVIMVVLIGVMGAGLLTFVQRDLNSVVETNKGQKALEIADAGVQAAKSHLRNDSIREHYDTVRSNDCTEGERVGPPAENWSPATQVWDNNRDCAGVRTITSPDEPGVVRNFAGGRFRVTIQCYTQAADASSPAPCNGSAGSAPEAAAQAKDRKFFKITSTGYDTVSNDAAVRKVEAIYFTQKVGEVPNSYYTPKNINFNGGADLKRLSFFAGGNITGTTQGSITVDRTTEALYRDWNVQPFNNNGAFRKTAAGTSIVGVGFGALGLVCGGNSCTDATSVADGRNDYDRTTGTKGQNRKFVLKANAADVVQPDQITFPFDPGTGISDPRTAISADLLEELKKAAQLQDNYIAPATSITINSWPGAKSIMFVDGKDVSFAVNSNPPASGILVVNNANFTLSNSSNGFQGVVIVVGDGNSTGNYRTIGNTALDGYAIASGTMDFGGSVTPNTSTDYTNLLNLYNIKLWSWRECYNTACN